MALSHAQPGEVVHLQPVGGGVSDATTAAIVKSDRFEAVRLVVAAGSSIPSHKVDGYFTLFCLSGHAVLEAESAIVLRAGDWVYLDRGTPHSVRAIEDSHLLLTIMFD